MVDYGESSSSLELSREIWDSLVPGIMGFKRFQLGLEIVYVLNRFADPAFLNKQPRGCRQFAEEIQGTQTIELRDAEAEHGKARFLIVHR